MARLSLAALLAIFGLLTVQTYAQRPFGPWKLASDPDGAGTGRVDLPHDDGPPSDSASAVLDEAYAALAVLQDSYYDPSTGRWPASIDWTGAVVETVVAGMLTTMTQALNQSDWPQKENLIASVYAQVVHSYFGQNAEAIKDQVRYPPLLIRPLSLL